MTPKAADFGVLGIEEEAVVRLIVSPNLWHLTWRHSFQKITLSSREGGLKYGSFPLDVLQDELWMYLNIYISRCEIQEVAKEETKVKQNFNDSDIKVLLLVVFIFFPSFSVTRNNK